MVDSVAQHLVLIPLVGLIIVFFLASLPMRDKKSDTE